MPEILIHGRHSRDWTAALAGDAPVWNRLAGIAQPAAGPARWWRRRVVVPLLERHLPSTPQDCHGLVPEPEAVAVLADKAKFAAYAKSIGAGRLLPRTFRLDRPKFPAVLKRTDLNSGNGVAVVASREQLDARLASAPWAGRPALLQALVPAHTDHVTYLVCVEGQVVWHRTYAYRLAQPDQIRGPVVAQTGMRKRTRPRDIRAFETLLLPLRYSGPANVDYRRRPDGSVAILEINPRLGGSLMKPENVGDLAACLAAIVRHARWRPAPSVRPAAASDEARA